MATMKIYINILVLIFTTKLFVVPIFTTKSLANECPLFSSLTWEISNLTAECPKGTAYHCRVHEVQPTAFCHAVLNCPPGTFADLVKAPPSPKLQCVSCPDDRFDPSGGRSNEISECRYVKQKCLAADHKILWRPGSATSDNICYCDFKASYEMDADIYGVIPETQIRICDGFTRCECRAVLYCDDSPDMCILPDKTCSGQCPPGFTRPNLSYECVPKDVTAVMTPETMPTSPFTITPDNMPSTPKSTEETLQNTIENNNWNPLLIFTVILACIVVVIILVILVICHRNRQRIGEHQLVDQNDTN